MSNQKVKVAIIGCGTIANSAHIPNYLKLENAEIKYFCDIIKEKADKAVEKYGVGTAVTDYREVLADKEVQAISICTPNNVHAEISIAALRAGKDVLCEKPAARRLHEALEMQKVAHETGRILNIGVCNRYNTAVNEMKKIIDSGELGEIYHVYVSFRDHRSIPGIGGAFTTKAISGGGVLIDWGVHYLDIVMYCTGDPKPLTVSANAYSKLGVDIPNYVYKKMWAEDAKVVDGTYDVDDFVTGFIRTEGPTISLNGAWAQNIGVKESYIDFIGTKGGIRLMYGEDFKVYTTKDGQLHDYNVEYEKVNMYLTEMKSFVDQIENREKLPSDIDTVVITAKILEGLYASSEQNKEIAL